MAVVCQQDVEQDRNDMKDAKPSKGMTDKSLHKIKSIELTDDAKKHIQKKGNENEELLTVKRTGRNS